MRPDKPLQLMAAFVLVITVFAAFACERPRTQTVSDASQRQTLTFAPTSIFDPSGYRIRVFGRVDGAAFIELPDNAPQMISGDVDWSISHDFFEPPLVIDYQPVQARSGRLTFRVQFQ